MRGTSREDWEDRRCAAEAFKPCPDPVNTKIVLIAISGTYTFYVFVIKVFHTMLFSNFTVKELALFGKKNAGTTNVDHSSQPSQ